jgi:4-hydroxy-tetrahydrodipicolinate synthase
MSLHSEIKEHLSGPIPSLSTPFTATGAIDYNSIANMLEFYIESGLRSIMLTAGDSHYLCLSDREIAELTEFVLHTTRKRLFVIAADRYFSTGAAAEFASSIKSSGADLLMLMPPTWGNSVISESLAAHYAEIAKIMPVMIVTNIFATNQSMGLETILRATEISENVVAVKDDITGAFCRKLAMSLDGRLALVSGGQKQNHLDVFPYGSCGYLSTFARFYPQIAKRYWDSIEHSDIASASAIIKGIDAPYFNTIFPMRGGFDSGIHGTLELFGLAKRFRRKPYTTIGDDEMDTLREFFRSKIKIPLR